MTTNAKLASLVVILAIFAGACGASAEEKRQTTLKYALTGINTARDGFVEWDRVHQIQIAERATSLEDGLKQLASYKEKRVYVEKGFEAAYRSLALAALELDLSSFNLALVEIKALGVLLEELTGKDFLP